MQENEALDVYGDKPMTFADVYEAESLKSTKDNEAGLVPLGHRVIVRMDEVERTTESGIVLPEEVADREEMSGTRATIIAVGASAWADQHVSGPWAKPGDHVMIAKWAGQLWKRNGIKYRVISDLDVIAVIGGES